MHPDISSISGVDPFAVPLRVLHVAQPTSGGVPRMVEQLARHEASGGWEVHVAADLPRIGASVNQHTWRARRNPTLGVVAEGRILKRIIRSAAPDIIVLHSAKAGLVGRLTVRGHIPTVFVPHAWSFLALPPPARFVAVGWERLAAVWTNAVIAVSDGEAEAGRNAGISAPTFVVPTGVPDSWVPVPYSDRGIIRRRLGLVDGATAVCVGRICPQKGQDVLLKAWAQVAAAIPGAQLVIVGGGSIPEASSSRVMRETVRFVGHQSRPHDYVAAADVVVLPSRYEGSSLVALEALAVGRSVVTTAVSGSETVSNSRAGAVVPINDVQKLADALMTRLSGGVDVAGEGSAGLAWVKHHRSSQVLLHRFAAVLTRAKVFGPPSRQVTYH